MVGKQLLHATGIASLAAVLLTSCAITESSTDASQQLEAGRTHYADKQDGWFSAEPKHDISSVLAKDNTDLIDPQGGLSRQGFKNELYKKQPPLKEKEELEFVMPDLTQFINTPEPPAIGDDKLVTLSVTEDVPLKDVLIELARRADVDMEIDSSISGGIIFSARNKPFSEVVSRVARLASLKYDLVDGVLRIARDVPVVKNYRFNILDMSRGASATASSSSELGGSSGGGESSGGGTGGGSSRQVSMETGQSDMWQVVEEGVSNILRYTGAGTSIAAPTGASGGTGGGSAGGGAGGGAGGSGTSGVATPQVPVAGEVSGIISSNRPAGIISILGTEKQHRSVKEYLDYVHMSYSSQVLIEAKVLEVSLNDDYRSGIDWTFLNNNMTGLTVNNKFDNLGNLDGLSDQLLSVGILPAELFGLNSTSLEASLDLVETFGVSRTLASPRLNAMNNQFAMLTFAENFVYFDITLEQEETEGVSTLTIESEERTVPVGLLLSLHPSIDLVREEVVMSVNPSLSRITSFKADPGVALQAAQFGADGVVNEVPIVEVREMDSVVRLQSGQIMVIGGLMQERTTNTDRGVPGLSEVPLLGNAFKNVQKISEIVETVIFLKATIVPGSGVTVEDRDFYRKFSTERRPLTFSKQ